jgi:hypothetical protein
LPASGLVLDTSGKGAIKARRRELAALVFTVIIVVYHRSIIAIDDIIIERLFYLCNMVLSYRNKNLQYKSVGTGETGIYGVSWNVDYINIYMEWMK